MAFIISTAFAGSQAATIFRNSQFSGQIHLLLTTGAASTRRIYLPPATAAMQRLVSGGNYGNRQYMVGGHTANILIDADMRCVRQSMPAPDKIPVVAVGGGTTLQICYTRFYDDLTGERSPLSEGLSVTGSVDRTWTELPTEVPNERVIMEGTCTIAAGTVTGTNNASNFGSLRPGDRIAISTDLTQWATVRAIASNTSMTIDDTAMAGVAVSLVAKTYSRASHVEQWVAVTGALPRLATRVRIGTTTMVESTATLSLGQAETASFTAMPLGEFSLFYNDRQLIAGVEGHRDTIYCSDVTFPERHGGLLFRTKYNEPIVGMFKFRDYVVVLCPDSSYRLQGYTEDDMALTVLEPDIGGFGHHGNKVAEGRAFVPGRKGVQIFNGAFHQGIPTRLMEWKKTAGFGRTIAGYGTTATERARAKVAYSQGLGVVNPNDETYRFFPNGRWLNATSSGGSLEFNPQDTDTLKRANVWVAQYNAISPQAGGTIATPEWLNDTSWVNSDSGYVSYAAYMVVPGERIGRMYMGSSKGRIYYEDDDSAWSGPDHVWVTGHLLMNDPGGNRDGEGKNLIRLWSYLDVDASNRVSGEAVGFMRVWPGDEYAYPEDPILVALGSSQGNVATPMYEGIIRATYVEEAVNIAGQGMHDRVLQPEIVQSWPVEQQGRGFTIEHRLTGGKLKARFIGLGGEWGPGSVSRPVREIRKQSG